MPAFSKKFVSSFHAPAFMPHVVKFCQCLDQSISSILSPQIFCIRISSSIALALSNLDFVLGSIREFVTWPLILGMTVACFLLEWKKGLQTYAIVFLVVNYILWVLRCSGVNNNEMKSYASSIFIRGRWIGEFNSTNDVINSHALIVMVMWRENYIDNRVVVELVPSGINCVNVLSMASCFN